eukprot:m.54161 g.54161  ORF g.54161 m.54161 type:complete len:391 (-) comp10907_c0_seq1:135-1307(-)
MKFSVFCFVAVCITPALCSPVLKKLDIFVPSARFPCFRQPAIATIHGAILAFAENRNVSACAPPLDHKNNDYAPDEVGSLQLRISKDGGMTWGPMQTLAVGNIDFYVVTPDPATGNVYLFLQSTTGLMTIVSKDLGASWSNSPFNVTVPAPFSSKLQPTVGHGIVINGSMCEGGCTHAGRLIVPMICQNQTASKGHGDKGACPSCTSCLMYSDDHGATWNFGASAMPGSRESEVAQYMSSTQDSLLYMNARNFGPNPGHRFTALCSGGGTHCDNFAIDSTLTSPITPHWTGIVDSVLTTPLSSEIHDTSRTGRIVFSGPASLSERANMTIRVSTDAGETWSSPAVIWEGPAGYSDLSLVDMSGKIAMIFENGEKSFADMVSVAIIDTTML